MAYEHPSAGEPCLSLGDYIRELIARLGMDDPDALDRMQAIVGERRARIVLDDEAVEAWFDGGTLHLGDGRSPVTPDGTGSTTRDATLDLLDGYEEVFEAVMAGRLDAVASIDDAARMFAAIEVILDASVRSPSVQALALAYRTDPCRAARTSHDPGAPMPRRLGEMYPRDLEDGEMRLLGRLDLLPDAPRAPRA